MKKAKKKPSDVQYILNVLRQSTIKWSGRSECLRRARKQVLIGYSKKGKPKLKLNWQCAICRGWFDDSGFMEVDHIVEIGSLGAQLGEKNFHEKLGQLVDRMYCLTKGQSNLQCVCQDCHKRKTGAYNSAASRWERKKR